MQQQKQKRQQQQEPMGVCAKRHASDELFIQNVRRKRALKEMGPKVFEIVSRLTRAIAIEPGTKLWLISTPPDGLTAFEAGAKRLPSTFVLDPAGVPDFELAEQPTKLFFATDTLALIDLRESSYGRSMVSPYASLIREIGTMDADGSFDEPFDFRFFADCVKGHGMRGFIWEISHAPMVTIFSPGATNVRQFDAKRDAKHVRNPESKFQRADPDLYIAMGMMRHLPNPHLITSDDAVQRWNCMDKDHDSLKFVTRDELEELYESGMKILLKMRREHQDPFDTAPPPTTPPRISSSQRADEEPEEEQIVEEEDDASIAPTEASLSQDAQQQFE
jgi:hypothetical protein